MTIQDFKKKSIYAESKFHHGPQKIEELNNLIHSTTWNYEIERNYLYLLFHLREKSLNIFWV